MGTTGAALWLTSWVSKQRSVCWSLRRTFGQILTPLVGQTLEVQISSIREKKAQIQVSQRALTEGNRAERKAFTLANLEEGQVLDGEVRRLTNFGAFVDIGGVDGLLHVKDMVEESRSSPRRGRRR